MNLQDASAWDVAIIGAGPAGGYAAAVLAAQGRSVLLIERSAWPREKVCGGCLNAVAVSAMEEAGLTRALRQAVPLNSVAWHVGSRSIKLSTPGGAAVLRSEMDAAIVAEAVSRGCVFIAGVSGSLLPAQRGDEFRLIRLGHGTVIKASAVLACDGICGTFLRDEPWAGWQITRGSWIGVSHTTDQFPVNVERESIQMYVGPGGYVGLVNLADGKIHLAAALDPAACRNAGGPAALIANIFRACGHDAPPATEKLHGTGQLTRHRKHISGYRVLAVGDACGYVEPFTGEGMSWAILAAKQAVDLLPAPGRGWPADLPPQWQKRHCSTIGRQQMFCRAGRSLMHHPALLATAVAAGNALPALAEFVAAQVSSRTLIQQGAR